MKNLEFFQNIVKNTTTRVKTCKKSDQFPNSPPHLLAFVPARGGGFVEVGERDVVTIADFRGRLVSIRLVHPQDVLPLALRETNTQSMVSEEKHEEDGSNLPLSSSPTWLEPWTDSRWTFLGSEASYKSLPPLASREFTNQTDPRYPSAMFR